MKKLFKRRRLTVSNQDGVVSFVTVMLLSIVLTLITVAFVKSTISNQRQSLDNQLSTQAFYAAESGVNDAIDMIVNHPSAALTALIANPNQDCDDFIGLITAAHAGANVLDSSSNTKYTCVKVTNTPEDISLTDIREGESSQVYPIRAASGTLSSLRITWGSSGQTATGLSTASLLAHSTWPNTAPPLLRVTYYYPNSFDGTTLLSSQKTFFIKPVSSGGVSTPQAIASTSDGSVIQVNCNAAPCVINMPVSAAWSNLFIKITPLYKAVSASSPISIEAFDNAGTSLHFQGAQYSIDVTGRANDVYKRIEIRRGVDATNSNLPAYAVMSGGSLCKQFSVWPTNGLTDEAAANCPAF